MSVKLPSTNFHLRAPAECVLLVGAKGLEYNNFVLFEAFYTVPMLVSFIEFSGPGVLLIKPQNPPIPLETRTNMAQNIKI